MAGFSEMTSKDLVRDIRSGMTDFELTEKYKLTPKEFHLALGALMHSGLVTMQQLEERQQLSESQIIRVFVESCED